jgi:phage shock protein E
MTHMEGKKRSGAGLAALTLAALLAWTNPSWNGAGPLAAERSVPGFQTIAAGQLAQMLREKDFLFVNVHITYEGEIAQTDAFIPFDQIGANLDKLPADRSAAIVLYCRSGRMSEIAANDLAILGYSNVAHLEGGMIEWENDGQQVLHR